MFLGRKIETTEKERINSNQCLESDSCTNTWF